MRPHIYCENAAIRTVRYFQTSTYVPHLPHKLRLLTKQHARLLHICISITLRKAIMPCFPQCNYARKNVKEKLCPACHGALRQNRAATAPQRASQTTSFRDRACSDLLWERRDSHASLLSNLHIVPHLPHKLQPFDWTYLMTWAVQLWATSWLSFSSVSYLLITLPLDWAVQLWATSWLLYLLTELFNCELPLDYSTSWLSCSIVSYLLITLPLGWAIQLFVTTEVSNLTSFEHYSSWDLAACNFFHPVVQLGDQSFEIFFQKAWDAKPKKCQKGPRITLIRNVCDVVLKDKQIAILVAKYPTNIQYFTCEKSFLHIFGYFWTQKVWK